MAKKWVLEINKNIAIVQPSILKRIFYIVFFACLALGLHAQSDSISGNNSIIDNNSTRIRIVDPRPIKVTSNIFRLQYGGEWAQDSYLSPLLYSGQYIGIGSEWWGRLPGYGRWLSVGLIDIKGGRSYNAPYTNMTYNLGLKGGWGTAFYWPWNTGALPGLDDSKLQAFIGPYLDLDFHARQLGNNVNKPVSFDIGADAEMMVGLQFTMNKKATAYRLGYLARMNVIGIEWLPDYWASYYEHSEKIDLKVACGWPGNRLNVHQELTLDLQFKKTTWRVGVEHEYLRYGRENMRFSRQTIGVVVGTCLSYTTWGTKLSN